MFLFSGILKTTWVGQKPVLDVDKVAKKAQNIVLNFNQTF